MTTRELSIEISVPPPPAGREYVVAALVEAIARDMEDECPWCSAPWGEDGLVSWMRHEPGCELGQLIVEVLGVDAARGHEVAVEVPP